MSFEQDEEILQDFLIEAGEILESLSEQLVELENDPDNADLLNAIFRGFHTVKGGAGFLSLTELVDTCHGAENVFDTLRNQQRAVTSELMDVILQALDTINDQFAQVQNQQALSVADPELLTQLHRLSQPEGQETPAAPVPPTAVITPEVTASVEANNTSDEMSEDEFERLLDELHGGGAPVASVPNATQATASSTAESDEMSDDEFESLLDELHGQGAPGSNVLVSSQAVAASTNDISDDEFESLLDELHGQGSFSPAVANTQTQSASSSAADDINDDEFESLLDELHGKGQGPTA